MMADYRALGRSSRATLRTTTLLFAALISASSASPNTAATLAATAEALLLLPSGGAVGLSTRGASAFRIRFLPPGATDTPPFVTPLIAPDAADAPFQRTTDGIKAAIGRLALSSDGRLSLLMRPTRCSCARNRFTFRPAHQSPLSLPNLSASTVVAAARRTAPFSARHWAAASLRASKTWRCSLRTIGRR